MKRLVSTLTVVVHAACLSHAQETVGPWEVQAAPIAATQIVDDPHASWAALNVNQECLSIDEAFSGFPIIDDGYANGHIGTTVELLFAEGALVNVVGPDLVFFEAAFDVCQYSIQADYDGFRAELTLPPAAFEDTGVDRLYWYWSGPAVYPASILAAPIDLSELGVPLGQTVTRVRFRAEPVEGFLVDPLGIGVLCECATVNYCDSTPNSTGSAAVISSQGSASFAANDLVLTAGPVPNTPGVFCFAATEDSVPFGNGFLCAAAPLFRLPFVLGQANEMTFALDLTAPPVAGVITPGTTWKFQAVFRDLAAGGDLFNLSDGLSATFSL